MNAAKQVVGLLLVAMSLIYVPDVSAEGVQSKRSWQTTFCGKFELAETPFEIKLLIEEMENCPYAQDFNEFWTNPVCHCPTKNDNTVPIIYNTATDVYKSEKFPAKIHDYLVNKRHDEATWLKMINTPTADGYTFLDFLQYNVVNGRYNLVEIADAASRIVGYLCANGGVYSKYKDSVQCPL